VKISRFSKIVLAILLALSLVLAMTPVTVFAAEGDKNVVNISVEKIITGSTPSTPATFTFKLTPVSANAPMPSSSQNSESSEDGSVTTTVTGSGTASFGAITYTTADLGKKYEYQVSEVNGNLANYTYDETVYTVIVTVLNDDNGELWALEKSHKTTSNVKTSGSSLVFTNKYTAPTPYVTPTPTPSESESPSEPESSEPTNSVETPSEPEEDTGSKTETPGTPIPDTSESSETNSPSDSDEPTYTGTSTSEVPNSEAETPVSQDTTSSVPSSTVPLSVSAPVTGNSTTPKTGDSSQVILWVALAAGSGIVLLFGFFLILRKRK
jgi:pilin isopeptide linkage protein